MSRQFHSMSPHYILVFAKLDVHGVKRKRRTHALKIVRMCHQRVEPLKQGVNVEEVHFITPRRGRQRSILPAASGLLATRCPRPSRRPPFRVFHGPLEKLGQGLCAVFSQSSIVLITDAFHDALEKDHGLVFFLLRRLREPPHELQCQRGKQLPGHIFRIDRQTEHGWKQSPVERDKVRR
jgi:hypothetical protein